MPCFGRIGERALHVARGEVEERLRSPTVGIAARHDDVAAVPVHVVSSRQTYSAVRSDFSVHDALV